MRSKTIILLVLLSILVCTILGRIPSHGIEIETVSKDEKVVKKETVQPDIKKETPQQPQQSVPPASQTQVQAPKQEIKPQQPEGTRDLFDWFMNEEWPVYNFPRFPNQMMKRFNKMQKRMRRNIWDDDFFGFHNFEKGLNKMRRRLFGRDPFDDFESEFGFDAFNNMQKRMQKFLQAQRAIEAERTDKALQKTGAAEEKKLTIEKKIDTNPKIKVEEFDQAFKLTVNLPENQPWNTPDQKGNINIEVLKNERTKTPLVKISLRKKEETKKDIPQSKENSEKKEFFAGLSLWSWSQSVYLKSPIIKEKVSAKFENPTTLVITCPKKQEKPKNNLINIE